MVFCVSVYGTRCGCDPRTLPGKRGAIPATSQVNMTPALKRKERKIHLFVLFLVISHYQKANRTNTKNVS